MKLEDYLKSLKFLAKPYNTNNSWGFGGGIGTEYSWDGIRVKIGKAYFRHLDSVPYITIRNKKNVKVFDEENTPRAQALAIDCINALINQ